MYTSLNLQNRDCHFAADCMGLYSFTSTQRAPEKSYIGLGQGGALRYLKVIEIPIESPLVLHCYYMHAYLLSFPRYNVLLVENLRFSPF